MNKLNLIYWVVFLTMLPLVTVAQNKVPQPSPKQTIKQVVGLTNVIVEYSRPSVKGRKIWGELVPFNKVWRTGANENTTIEFDSSITVGDKKVEAGKYALYVKPSENTWEIYLYKDNNNWGVPKKWDESKVVAKSVVSVHKIPVSISTFTISFDDVTSNGASLGLMWDKVYVGFKFEVPTKKLMEKIVDVYENGPTPWVELDIALYYSGINEHEKAKKWIDSALKKIEKMPQYDNNKWYVKYQKVKIYKNANYRKEAKMVAKEVLKKVKELAKTEDDKKEMVKALEKLVKEL